MSFSIYVAAASTEITRAEHWMGRLRDAGIIVTSSWPQVIKAAGGVANPATASLSQRRGWAAQDVSEVETARALWYLSSAEASRGAFFEFGYAYGRSKLIWVSGADQAKSNFTSLATFHHDSDEAAFADILAIARTERG